MREGWNVNKHISSLCTWPERSFITIGRTSCLQEVCGSADVLYFYQNHLLHGREQQLDGPDEIPPTITNSHFIRLIVEAEAPHRIPRREWAVQLPQLEIDKRSRSSVARRRLLRDKQTWSKGCLDAMGIHQGIGNTEVRKWRDICWEGWRGFNPMRQDNKYSWGVGSIMIQKIRGFYNQKKCSIFVRKEKNLFKV